MLKVTIQQDTEDDTNRSDKGSGKANTSEGSGTTGSRSLSYFAIKKVAPTFGDVPQLYIDIELRARGSHQILSPRSI